MDNSKQLLVFVNPASGKGHAVREWNKAKVVFDKFGIKYKVIMTSHRNHCQEYLLSEDLSNVYGVVLVSGDGLPHEAINALYNRSDWEKVRDNLAIGVLPGGSGNAFAKTLSKMSQLECNSESCALIIAKGMTRQMDLIQLEMPQQRIVSFLSLAYAFISEVDLGSEGLRFLGGARFDIYGTWRALFQKKYQVKLNNKQMILRYFLAQKIPYISDNYLSGPAAKIDDGMIDLQYLEDGGWTELVKLSLKQYDGKHVQIDDNGNVTSKGQWKYEKVKEFTFEPITECPFSIDGEHYPPQPVKATVLNKVLKVFCY